MFLFKGKRKYLHSTDLISYVGNKYYNFKGSMNIPILFAEGSSPTFGYHRSRGSSKMYLYKFNCKQYLL